MSSVHTIAMCEGQWAQRTASGDWRGYAARCGVLAPVSDGLAPFAGAEFELLEQRLAACIAPVHGRLMDEVTGAHDEIGLVRWLREGWDQRGEPAVQRLAVSLTRDRGADMNAAGEVFAWRRYRLRCAHFLPHVPMGHKCGRLHGHDFEVIVHTRVQTGEDGFSKLDEAWAPLHFALNYRKLNEIKGLENPTSENMSAWIWAQLGGALPGLAWVTVFETQSCGANFDGRNYRIWKEFTFDSATQWLRAPAEHPAARVHGHTYTLRLHLKGPIDELLGWTQDFGDVKRAFAPQFDQLDHQPLHELAPELDGGSKAWAAHIALRAHATIPALERVTLLEGPNGGAMWLSQDEFLPLPL